MMNLLSTQSFFCAKEIHVFKCTLCFHKRLEPYFQIDSPKIFNLKLSAH